MVAPNPKRSSGRKVFKETRHPVYRGVRRRSRGKWVCEVREPNKKSKIWLGTFSNPEMAAVAHDVAALALRGDNAMLNFPSSTYRLPRPHSSSHQDIKSAAAQAAREFSSSASISLMLMSENASHQNGIQYPSDSLHAEITDQQKIDDGEDEFERDRGEDEDNIGYRDGFVDEEALFSMPILLDSMAEGMLLTPPAMKKGFNWTSQDEDEVIDLTLWGAN
ncbi:dehydration-responsive element-binding protein 1D-like [Sesamum indicum]|uniref:Dehydration-responsive element-binding protein 1D-like n=1 Tax=Sesamum indicum TaxID=4182 RepID=A0A8M8V0J7_SESIN|nr:dehydration-responsive element-binding protein 1D-like [Sesamum indicum]